MQIKEKKELEEQFKRAQKPWVKLLEKCDKAKSNYHLACKNEKSAVNQERNATKDSSLSQDAVRIFESSFIHYFIQTFLELFILCCVVCGLLLWGFVGVEFLRKVGVLKVTIIEYIYFYIYIYLSIL